jgi:hypothetical protein
VIVSHVRQVLRQLQAEARVAHASEDHGMTGQVPPDLSPTTSYESISRHGFGLRNQVLSLMGSHPNYEHLDNQQAEGAVWRFVCMSIKDRGSNHVEPFLTRYHKDATDEVIFFSVRHLQVTESMTFSDCDLLPIDDPTIPAGESLREESDVGSVVRISETGTSMAKQVDRARIRAEYALDLLRVCLRRHNQFHAAQMRFSLGERFATEHGTGWKRRSDVAYDLTVNPGIVAGVKEWPAASLALVGSNDLERHARLAVDWLARARLTPEPLMETLFLFFALEALLGDRQDKKKGHDLAFRRAMLSHVQRGGFTTPDATYLLYDQVRSAAVHGSASPEVPSRMLVSLDHDVSLALDEYLEFAAERGLTRRSAVMRALRDHPDSGDMVLWLHQHASDLSCTVLVGHSIDESLDVGGDLRLGGEGLSSDGDGDLA